MNTTNFSKYFKDAIASQPYKAISLNNSIKVTATEIDNGILFKETLKIILKKFNLEKESCVIIVYKNLQVKYNNLQVSTYRFNAPIGCLYIPARLSLDGILSPDSDNLFPYIPREYLTPIVEPTIILGDTSSFDDFLTSTQIERSQISCWLEYLNYAQKLYSKIAQKNIDELLLSGNVTECPDIFILPNSYANSTTSLSKLYSSLIETKEKTPLYELLLQGTSTKSSLNIPLHKDLMLYQYAQINNHFPAAPSQRNVIACTNILSSNSIVAVSGPPGTGKTTLLQSIVANEYVNHALNEDNPPIIVLASSNNQAIINILDVFKNIFSQKTITDSLCFFERWIVDENTPISFATYFPSLSSLNRGEPKYQFCTPKKTHFFQELSSSTALDEAKKLFLHRATSYFKIPEITDIETCQMHIKSYLQDLENARKASINSLFELTDMLSETQSLQDKFNYLQQKLIEYSNLILEANNKCHKYSVYIDLSQKRLESWKIFIYKHRLLIFLSKLLKLFKRLLDKKILKNMQDFEQKTIKTSINLNNILDYYKKAINSFQQMIAKIQAEINSNQTNLTLCKEELNRLLSKKENYINDLQYLKQFNSDFNLTLEETVSKETLINALEEKLDIYIRFMEFWCSVHYYECFWIMKKNNLHDNQWSTTFTNVLEKLYYRISLISPCFVTTLFNLPSVFNPYVPHNEKINTFMYNFIDLLIIDEAGQVSPEIGAGCFALAKKALVLGDECQIPPIWNTSKVVDATLEIENKLITILTESSDFIFSCSHSNILRIAKHACFYHDSTENQGLFLQEHRRCYDEIIAYCNELIYKNRLIPLVGSAGTNPTFEPMQHINVITDYSNSFNNSRYNEKEAIAIAEWIKNNMFLIREEFPNTPIHNIIGIVTPFTAQKSCINKHLKHIGQKDCQLITIGTVHSFQGGEREIILFSSVYGEKESCNFIDSNPQLMNVAVSRAKKAFIVFGSYNCLKNSHTTASGLLKKYLKRIVI